MTQPGGNPTGTQGKAIDVAAALVFRDGKLLITQRYPEAHLGGMWEFPGGKREQDEGWHECLVREIREELGIEIQILESVEDITHHYPEKSVHLRFFRCLWVAHEPQPLGCPDFRWVRKEELDHYKFPGADARLLELLKQTVTWWSH